MKAREEEISKACEEIYNKLVIDSVATPKEFGEVCMRWADKHPKNPWHKTDDGDFPKEGIDYQMKDGEFLCGKPMLLHICEDDDDSGDDYKGYFDGKFWRYWDKPMSCDAVMGKVTQWMRIPELLKEERL